MATATISTLEGSIHKTNAWLGELTELGRFTDEAQAYSAMRAVLHALRDRLTIEEAADLASQLPMIVRGFYYEGWRPSLAPNKDEKTPEQFLEHVKSSLPRNQTIDPQHAARAVFQLLDMHLTRGQADDVRQMLPRHIAEAFWPK